MKRQHTSINKGLQFLETAQQRSGGFGSVSAPDHTMQTDPKEYFPVFPTALILWSLQQAATTDTSQRIQRAAAHFLIKEKSERWTWNYWSRRSLQYKQMPYPDDMDDTANALAAIVKFDKSMLTGDVMAHMVSTLTSLEIDEGGPYRTWIVPPTAPSVWRDVDVAVNANIALCLSQCSIQLPKLTSFIEKSITQNKLQSPYYPNELPIIYFISRWYRGQYADQLVKKILRLQHMKSHWGSPLMTALALVSLHNLRYSHTTESAAQRFLFTSQQPDGSWPAEALYIDPAIKGIKQYAGSPALTTALCLEALHQKHSATSIKPTTPRLPKAGQDILQTISKKIAQRSQSLDKDIKKETARALQSTLKADKSHHITLLPFFFDKTLQQSTQVPKRILANLGLANLYGWAAYTIYDNFFDDEGNIHRLSTANLCLREVCEIFNDCHLPTHFHFHFQSIMDSLDAANAWEVKNCRVNITNNRLTIPDRLPRYSSYQRLADRSMGHALGPLALISLRAGSRTIYEKNVAGCIAYFNHYIIARQLNDDAHDWYDDLCKGHLNSVGTLLLKKWKRKTIHLQKDEAALRRLFWTEVVNDVSSAITSHARRATKALHQTEMISDTSYLENLLKPIQQAAHKAKQESVNTQSFIKAL